jgi:uncharacterized membrane protein YhaH (DUF805 family)
MGEFVMEYMLMPFRRYAEFTGRSGRKEYWMFILFNVIVGCVLGAIIAVAGGAASMQDAAGGNYGAIFGGLGLLMVVWWLAVIIPSIAVGVRRLHDRDMSGWWYLGFIVLSVIPLIGIIASIAFIVIMALPGTPGPNRFGPEPYGNVDPEVFA